MEKISFTRQSSDPATLTANDFNVHVYPFTTLPVVVSHIHPKFVIMATGAVIAGRSRLDVRQALFQQFPTLQTILTLSVAWGSAVPDDAEENESYWPPDDPNDDDDDDNGDNG
ncbi:hypothetical protein AX14_001128 [Amanita brunnescens Koide BX004]|nr:hypothetical protein AX14_001128 [Amanita brunnescens Koide BX004]